MSPSKIPAFQVLKINKINLDCYIKLVHYKSNESRIKPSEALPVRTRPAERRAGVPANHRPGDGWNGRRRAGSGRSAPHRAAARGRSRDKSQYRDSRLSGAGNPGSTGNSSGDGNIHRYAKSAA